MIRSDGNFTIYMVQARLSNKWYRWDNLAVIDNIPRVPVRYENEKDKNNGKEKSPFYDVGAGGECWQKVGVYGVFNIELAKQLLDICQKYNPDTKFRIQKVEISQKITIVKKSLKDIFNLCNDTPE